MCQNGIIKEINGFRLDEKENITYRNLWDSANTMLEENL